MGWNYNIPTKNPTTVTKIKIILFLLYSLWNNIVLSLKERSSLRFQMYGIILEDI